MEMIRRIGLILVLAGLAVAANASPAAAQEMTAASCSPSIGIINTGGNERLGEVFSPSLSGAFTKAEIEVHQAGTAGDYVVQLMGVDPGTDAPNNTVLASTTVPDSMPDQTYLLSATFSPPASVAAGQGYALVITRPGSDNLTTGIRVDCPGRLYISNAGTTDWIEQPNVDFVFTAFVTPPPPPTPPGTTGQRAAALKSCRKKAKQRHWSMKRLKKCKKKARVRPV